MFLRWYWFFEVGVYVVLRGFGKLVGVSTEDRENNMVANRLGSIGCENVRKVPSSERTKAAKGLVRTNQVAKHSGDPTEKTRSRIFGISSNLTRMEVQSEGVPNYKSVVERYFTEKYYISKYFE